MCIWYEIVQNYCDYSVCIKSSIKRQYTIITDCLHFFQTAVILLCYKCNS